MKMPVLGEDFNGGMMAAATAGPDDIARRALLIGLPLAGSALAVPLAVKAATETPVLLLFREWEAMNAQMDTLVGEAADSMLENILAVERRLRCTPCTGVADFAAKVAAFTFWGGACLDEEDAPEIWAEARAMLREFTQ